VAHRSCEKFSPSATDLAADDEDLGRLFEVRVERSHGVAGEVDVR
jgi:hypothetical protein